MREQTVRGRRVAGVWSKEEGQSMVEYGLIAAALLVGLALAIKAVQVGLLQVLHHQHQGLANAP